MGIVISWSRDIEKLRLGAVAVAIADVAPASVDQSRAELSYAQSGTSHPPHSHSFHLRTF